MDMIGCYWWWISCRITRRDAVGKWIRVSAIAASKYSTKSYNEPTKHFHLCSISLKIYVMKVERLENYLCRHKVQPQKYFLYHINFKSWSLSIYKHCEFNIDFLLQELKLLTIAIISTQNIWYIVWYVLYINVNNVSFHIYILDCLPLYIQSSI